MNNYLEAKGLNNNLTDFDSSVFKNGFKAKDINLTNSTLLNSINNYEGNSFVLNGAKLGEKYDNKANVIINNGYLKATNSLINMGIKSSNNINIELVGTTLIGNTYDLNNNKKIINNLTANNSRILGAFSVNNLNVSNSTFYLSNNNYDGAIISKISTSGIDNNFGILTALTKDSNGTYKVNNLNSNLPLAILKVGNGNANINSFIKDLKFYSGISEFALANSYLSKKEIINGNDRYLVYALTNNKNMNFDDLEFNSKKLDISAINNLITDTSKINEYADIKDTIKTSVEANQLSNETTNKDKSQNNIGILVANFDNKSIPWIDLKPANPIKPTTPPNIEDTKPSEPEIKPDIKPEVTPETPINPNENIKPNPNEEAKPEIKPNIPWIDLKPVNPIKPSEPKTDEEKFEIALEEQKEAIKLMVTGKNEKALESAKLMTSQFYFSQVFEYNNLNKRLGELRSFTNNNAGIWIRGYINKGSIKNTSIKANEIQLGADKIINNNDFDTYAGIMLNIGKTTTDNTTNSKINNYGFGVYVSNVYNNGFFLDATFKTNHYKSEFKNDTFLGNSTSKGTGIIASAELGYRFGDEFYLEPSLELIANYIPKTDIKGEKVIQFGNLSQVSNVNITSSSKVLMVSKAAVYTGVDINNTILRAGIGGIFDLTNNPDFLVSDGISSFAFSGAKKDKRGFASIGLNKNISKKLGLNIEAEKTFSGNLNIDYNINASIRFEF
ncbi:autotransporter outer membrane beta-barrel domain-containing protein [Campylobacter sp. RM12642]|uniref:autotransporter outer membrane beta-barrel domain-containing protein n=1 Tax=Campylobacter sp. RM12642 TaxID=2735736 RepID=UPI003014228D|nr:autotransporter outer membrane beta-barrel domain-containing protein [Campylobacter sp. RM12642]